MNREKTPIILLSGPSGSGKTTSALMIEKILDSRGIETHTLSLDNYFSPLTDREKILLSEGKLDLESPNRIDSEFLTQQLREIYHCRPVELPVYDFKESTRIHTGKILHRKPGELVILEGIHSLNPDVIPFKDSRTAKIYVSVRTRIRNDGTELHPCKIRLMRRLVRDYLFRKRSFRDTLMMFHSVEDGENKYIMPYKYRSTYDVDTFMPYEICAYRNFLLESLQNLPENPITEDMIDFLEHTAPIRTEEITPDSLICEFIGNGQFCYS
ncbi:MAG: nucleoside kinase [Oscillospiraceae bacterium]|nr:nucleoside kinase [Oscillospiraceae bacterium]